MLDHLPNDVGMFGTVYLLILFMLQITILTRISDVYDVLWLEKMLNGMRG